MTRTTRLAILLALTALVAGGLAGPASAAKRRVPAEFFGTTLASEFLPTGRLPDQQLEEQMARMASSGVESLRIVVDWRLLEPNRDAYDFASIERYIGAAARHGIRFVPNVTASPRWISSNPESDEFWRYPPRDPRRFAALMERLVLRYGSRGTFWQQNRLVPKLPVRQWQLWNEPNAPFFWRKRPWATGYTRLLRVSRPVIKRADPRAKIVSGGLVGVGGYAPWDAARDLFKAGARRYVDAVAIHPFTHNPTLKGTVEQAELIIERIRTRMSQRGGRRTPVVLTEVTWPAAIPALSGNATLGLSTTARGQAARLRAVYRRLISQRKRLRINQIYWFTWASPYDRNANPSVAAFRYSGLMKYSGGSFSPMPILGTYTSLAARYQGCRKSTDARRCA